MLVVVNVFDVSDNDLDDDDNDEVMFVMKMMMIH